MSDKKCISMSSNMSVSGLFDEDSVSVTKNGHFSCGVVVESSEYISSDDDDDDDSPDDKLRRGTVRVAWHPEGTEEIYEENMVKLPNSFSACFWGHYKMCRVT